MPALGNGAPAMATSVAEAEARRGTICAPRTLKRIAEGRNCRPGVERGRSPNETEGNAQKIPKNPLKSLEFL